jgi:2-dehydro-3-deoxyglucarate aldolase/4-hydroxy-2-oxoheptanedioate aldolase
MFDKKELIRGVHVSAGHPMLTELLSHAGFDAMWIDTEHSAMDKHDVLLNLIATSGSKTAAIVRVPWNDPVLAKPILEMGPDGIVFPFIKSAEEARRAVAACLYPPDGVRGFGPIRAVRYGFDDTTKYVKESSKTDFWKIMQIEHLDGVRDMDNILAVPGVDAIVLGPNDLSASLGVLPNTGDPQVIEAVKIVKKKTNAAGIPFGVSAGYSSNTNSGAEFWLDLGVDFLFIGSDVSFVFDGAQATLKHISPRIVKR